VRGALGCRAPLLLGQDARDAFDGVCGRRSCAVEITRPGADIAGLRRQSYFGAMRTNLGPRGPTALGRVVGRTRSPRSRRFGERSIAATLVAGSLVSVVCALSGCTMGEDKPAACEGDESLCPSSSRQATDLACDCRCVAGYAGITPTRVFEGEISACLPPDLNASTASPEQREMLVNMPSGQFNQRVFKYCSEKVASFLNEVIEDQQRPRDLRGMCMGPRIRCSCSTTGAHEQTPACSAPCADRECDRENCLPMLKVGGIVDASGCACSRVNACGSITPPAKEPPLCLNRVAAVLRRKMKQRRAPARDAASKRVPVQRRQRRLTMV
jgi:hypothetical protein